MASARTHCPQCLEQAAEPLSKLLRPDAGEYFICAGCHYVWVVPVGQSGPPVTLAAHLSAKHPNA